MKSILFLKIFCGQLTATPPQTHPLTATPRLDSAFCEKNVRGRVAVQLPLPKHTLSQRLLDVLHEAAKHPDACPVAALLR